MLVIDNTEIIYNQNDIWARPYGSDQDFNWMRGHDISNFVHDYANQIPIAELPQFAYALHAQITDEIRSNPSLTADELMKKWHTPIQLQALVAWCWV